jgi:hypothetical protein
MSPCSMFKHYALRTFWVVQTRTMHA